MKTTLNKIREYSPCEVSWKKLLRSLGKTEAYDTEVTVRYILDLLGVEDAIWSLRAVEGHNREMRLFACDCAESVLYLFEERYPDDNRPRNAIKVSRRFTNGEATLEELAAARAAAWAAAWGAAWYAAGDTAWYVAGDTARAAASDAASDAAWCAARGAAWCAARGAEHEKQREFLIKYI